MKGKKIRMNQNGIDVIIVLNGRASPISILWDILVINSLKYYLNYVLGTHICFGHPYALTQTNRQG